MSAKSEVSNWKRQVNFKSLFHSLVIDYIWTCHNWKISRVLLREWQNAPDPEINIDSDLSNQGALTRNCAAPEYRKQRLNITLCIFSKHTFFFLLPLCLWCLALKTILINIAAEAVSVTTFLSSTVRMIEFISVKPVDWWRWNVMAGFVFALQITVPHTGCTKGKFKKNTNMIC